GLFLFRLPGIFADHSPGAGIAVKHRVQSLLFASWVAHKFVAVFPEGLPGDRACRAAKRPKVCAGYLRVLHHLAKYKIIPFVTAAGNCRNVEGLGITME